MIIVAHRIQLMPNNKQKTYFRKAIGCCRLAYNWGLAEWKRRYKEGERGLSGRKLRNDFNAIRCEQFPFTYEVTKYATAHAFDDLQTAYTNFFEHRADYPKPHKKKDGEGSFYVGSDQAKLSDTHKGLKHLKKVAHNVGGKRQYVNIPNLGYVKMSERLRFNGKILGVKISQNGERFFASFQVQITEEEYRRTHPEASREKHGAVGIDLGLKKAMMLSDGIAVSNPRPLRKHQRKITRLSRQLSKRQHGRGAVGEEQIEVRKRLLRVRNCLLDEPAEVRHEHPEGVAPAGRHCPEPNVLALSIAVEADLPAEDVGVGDYEKNLAVKRCDYGGGVRRAGLRVPSASLHAPCRDALDRRHLLERKRRVRAAHRLKRG